MAPNDGQEGGYNVCSLFHPKSSLLLNYDSEQFVSGVQAPQEGFSFGQ